MFKTVGTTTGSPNGQHNALGVAFDGTAGPVRLETTLINPPAGNERRRSRRACGSAPARTTTSSSSWPRPATTTMRVQLMREINGVSNGSSRRRDQHRQPDRLGLDRPAEHGPRRRPPTPCPARTRSAPRRPSPSARSPCPPASSPGSPSRPAARRKTFAGIFATHRNRTAASGSLVYRFGEFLLTNDVTAPAAPTGLVATTASTTSVGLDWADNGEADLAGYDVYRAPNPEGPYTKITASPVTAPRTPTPGLTTGTLYAYQVRALDSSGNVSAASAAATALPDAASPPGGDLPGPGQLPVRDARPSRPATPATSARTTPTSAASAGSCPAPRPRAAWSATAATGTTADVHRPAPRHAHAHAGQQRHRLRQRRPAGRLGDRRPQRDLQRRGQRRRRRPQAPTRRPTSSTSRASRPSTTSSSSGPRPAPRAGPRRPSPPRSATAG